MRIIETCPKCGHDLVDSVIATYPPIPQKKCFNCGWEWTGEAEEVVRVPFGGNTYTNTTDTVTISLNDYINTPVTMPEVTLNGGVDGYITERYVPVQPSDAAYDSSSCKYCSNNPKNGGSGICHCILGQEASY